MATRRGNDVGRAEQRRTRRRPVALFAIKLAHSAIFWLVEIALARVLWDGVRRRATRVTGLAATTVLIESMIYAGNGFRCPLSTLAERLGADRGSVTDIFLPRLVANWLPAIHVPILATAIWLHRGRCIRSELGGSDHATSETGRLEDRGGTSGVPRRL